LNIFLAFLTWKTYLSFCRDGPDGKEKKMQQRKYTFLIPLLDNESQPFLTSDWEWLQDQLVVRFGGWSLDGRVEGAWRDEESGQVYRDNSVRYVVVVSESAVPGFFAFLHDVKAHFKQLALYVERPVTEVTFL
jgi:hypothetical protein